MLIKENELIAPYTTFKIGGITPKLLIPENEEELVEVIKAFQKKGEQYYLLGNGSNILVADKNLSRKVILNTQSCNYINFKEQGIVEVGASVDLSKLIVRLIEHNLESPVAMQTIPATVGGAIFQNASRNSFKVSISNNLLCVKYFDGESIQYLPKEAGRFSWRYSIFQEYPHWVILSAIFQFQPQSKALSKQKRTESIKAAANKSYLKKTSAGSIFKLKSLKILQYFQGIRIGKAEFSSTTLNTIHNLGEAKFRDVMLLIYLAKIVHWLCRKKAILEIVIWQ